MKEWIRKYKNGLLGVIIYLPFALWDLFISIPYTYRSINKIYPNHILLGDIAEKLIWLVIYFLLFQYVFKLIPKSSPVVLKPGDPFYEDMAKERSNHLLRILVGTIVSFFLGFLFFKGGAIENLLGDIVGGFSFFIGIIFLFGGSLKSVTLYRKTKDRKFLVFIFSFLIVLLGIYLYGVS